MPAKLIDESIEVIAHFDENGIRPLRFKWKDNVYRISEVWNTYTYEEKQSKQANFHVHVKGDSNTDYQLILNTQTLTWKLGFVQRHNPDDDFIYD